MTLRVATIAVSIAVLGAGVASTVDGNPGSDARGFELTASRRPAGPAAELSKLSGGNGVFMGEGTPPDLQRDDYVQREYAAAGTATAYKAAGTLTPDGRWNFEPDATAPYRTRVVVRAPAEAENFSGNVVVEWLNVSGGVDANPDWASSSEEIVRARRRLGRRIGPADRRRGRAGAREGGASPVPARLRARVSRRSIPARYGTLEHPGDGFSFDIFTQVARAVRAGAGLRRRRARSV